MSSRSPSENGSNVGGGGGTIASTIRRFKTLSTTTTTTTNLPPPVDVKLRRIATKENLAKIEVHKAKKVDGSWFITATAMVAPFAAFCFSHQLGLTEKALKVIYNRVGVHGFLALPFMTLAMEKSIYGKRVCYSRA